MIQALSAPAKEKKGRQVLNAITAPFTFSSQVRRQSKELSWVLAGKVVLLAANAALMLFLANRLELKMYGLLVVTISGQLLISRFLLMGVDVGMVRLTATPELKLRSRAVVTAGLVSIALTSSSLLVLMLLCIPLLMQFDVRAWVLPCIVAGSIGTALVDYGYSFRLAHLEYPKAALAQGGTAVWRLSLTTLAALKFSSYPFLVFVAYHGASLLSGLVQTLLISRVGEQPDRALIKQLLRYSVWLGKANIIVIFSFYQGTLLLMLLNQTAATGLYGLALTLSLGFSAISSTYSEYLLAKVRSVEHIGRFIKRAVIGALILILASVPVVLIVARLMPWFLGPEWDQAVPIFICLASAMVVLFLQAPLVAVCHYLLKPQLITIGWVLRAILIGMGGLLLAPQWGAMGAAVAQLIGTALTLIPLTLLVVSSLRSAKNIRVQHSTAQSATT